MWIILSWCAVFQAMASEVMISALSPVIVASSASKSSIRRFVITEKAPTTTTRPSLMTIALRSQFHVERPWGQRLFSIVS